MNANTKQEVAAILRKKMIEIINGMTDDELLFEEDYSSETGKHWDDIEAIIDNAQMMFKPE